MSHRLVIPLVALVAFGAGYGARVWSDRDVMPSPPTPGSEFVRPSEKDKQPPPPRDRAKLLAEIEKVRPQSEAYRKRLDEIETEFNRDFVALLNPEQRERYDAQKKKSAENHAKRAARDAADTSMLTDEQIERMRRFPLWNALDAVAITWRFERLHHDYKLDDAQQARLRDHLKARREKFLALVDTTTPPTISFSQLATQTQKLADPKTETKAEPVKK
jgi:hypothetical protein